MLDSLGNARSRRILALLVPFALVATLTSASWAAPSDPVPVKDDPHVVEGAPTSHGGWLGWTQDSRRDASHRNLFVQRGTQAPVRVNAPGTQGLSGGLAGHRVYYAQKFRDRNPRIIRFDPVTGDRTPLPPKVNHRRHREYPLCCGGPSDHKHRMLSSVRGNVTVSGPWLLYSGYLHDLDDDFLYDTVMLYNRVNHELRTITSNPGDGGVTYAGQVNGRYATYWWSGRCGGEEVYRYDLKTKRTVSLPLPADDVWDPGVSADGTAYYVHRPEGGPAGGPYTYELVRQPIGAPVEVVTTLTTDTRSGPGETYVRDRPYGTRVVFFSWQDDAYKLVDRPPAAATRSR